VIRKGPHAPNPAPHPSTGGAHGAVRDWVDALVTVLAALAAMAVVAALGLWAAGAADLPGGAFPRVVAAVVVIAAGGSVGVAATIRPTTRPTTTYARSRNSMAKAAGRTGAW
jgi:hypothetical protein